MKVKKVALCLGLVGSGRGKDLPIHFWNVNSKVTPADHGICDRHPEINGLDPGFRRDDGILAHSMVESISCESIETELGFCG